MHDNLKNMVMENDDRKTSTESTLHDNLKNMVMEDQEELPKEEIKLEVQEEVDLTEQPKESKIEEVVPPQYIKKTTLSKWIQEKINGFENINQVRANISGVDSEKTIILTSHDLLGTKDSDGNIKKKIHVFENADEQEVLDLDSTDMKIYNNGFKILYNFEGLVIKCYGIKSGLVVTFCHVINNQHLPYGMVKVNKNDDNLIVFKFDRNAMVKKLKENAQKEDLVLLYKQISKVITKMTTNQEIIDWLLERQNGIVDVNHHIQIDNLLITTLT